MKSRFGTIALAMLSAGTQAQAATPVSWKAPVDGDWTNGAYWSTGVAPDNSATTSYEVTIAAPSTASYRVYLSNMGPLPAKVDSLSLAGFAQL